MKKRSQSTENAPVVLFAYNRVNVLKKTIEALSKIWKLKKQNYLFFRWTKKQYRRHFKS